MTATYSGINKYVGNTPFDSIETKKDELLKWEGKFDE